MYMPFKTACTVCRVAHKHTLKVMFVVPPVAHKHTLKVMFVVPPGGGRLSLAKLNSIGHGEPQPTQALTSPIEHFACLGGRVGKCIYTCPGVYTFAGWYNWLLLVVCRREWLYPSGVQLASAGCTSEGVQEIQEIQGGLRRRDFLEFLEFLEFLDFVCLLQPSRTVPGSSGDFAFSAFVAVFIHHVNFGLNLLRN